MDAAQATGIIVKVNCLLWKTQLNNYTWEEIKLSDLGFMASVQKKIIIISYVAEIWLLQV